MLLKTFLGIVSLILVIFTTNTEQRECFTKGECKESFQISGSVLDNQYECRKQCQSTQSCTWFTYFERTSYCQLYKNCFKLDESSCRNCFSGEKDCTAPELKCWITGRCLNESFPVNTTVLSSEECLDLCQTEADCKWFTFDSSDSSCDLYSECSDLVGCDTCISGNYKCSKDSKEKEWHLIIGGAGSPNTVELYNWHTSQQCQLPNLPVGVFGHVAAFMEGVPVFCEAGVNRRFCYKMDKTSKKWVSISSLLAGVEYGKSVYVESQGWAVFGQLGNDLQKAQLLPTLTSDWKEGTPLISNSLAHKEGQCIFQISDIKTGFLYDEEYTSLSHNSYNYNRGPGSNYYESSQRRRRVLTILDWSTMSFSEQKLSDVTHESQFPACSVVKDTKQDLNIALTSGIKSKGMDLIELKSLTKIRTQVSSQLPMEMLTDGLGFSQLLPINNGTELLLYGGQSGDEIFDGIYKFSMVTKRWMKLGKMIFPRAAHTVIPVQGITCPQQ